jgi:hypothetical protein
MVPRLRKFGVTTIARNQDINTLTNPDNGALNNLTWADYEKATWPSIHDIVKHHAEPNLLI